MRGDDTGLRFDFSGPCYFSPNFSHPGWTYPGSFPSISVRGYMSNYVNYTQSYGGGAFVPCCLSTSSGLEIGLRNVSFSNQALNKVSQSCQCPGYTCSVEGYNVSQGWYANNQRLTAESFYSVDDSDSTAPFCTIAGPYVESWLREREACRSGCWRDTVRNSVCICSAKETNHLLPGHIHGELKRRAGCRS